MKQYVFGADVGGTTIKLGLFDTEGTLVEKWEIPTRKENNGEHVLDDLCASVKDKMVQRGIKAEEVIGLGVDAPGPVNAEGYISEVVNIGLKEGNLKHMLEEKSGFKVEVSNDANAAALGEMWMGGGKGYNSIAMLTLGTGVGGGIVIGGKILSGAVGAAGEIGHVTIDYNETESCNCGKKGCLEQYASATGIVRMAKKQLAACDTPSVLRGIENITAKDVLDAAKAGDEIGLHELDRLGRNLAIACSHIALITDPEAFVIGGGVSKAGDIILDAIKKYYNGFCMKSVMDKPFMLAALGNDAGIYGCARMLLEK